MTDQEYAVADERGARPWMLWGPAVAVFLGIVVFLLLHSRPDTPEEVFLSQLVVRYDVKVEGDYERARAKIERVRAELLTPGRGFAAVVYVEDETIARRQTTPGEVGWIGRGMMPPQVEQTAFALELDEISEIIEDNRSFRIITITDRRGFAGKR